MDSIITTTTHQPIALPEARVGITIRPGTADDIAFIDKLQKKQSKEVGFFPTMAIEGKIRLGHVLVAEATGVASGQWSVASENKRVVSGQWSVASENKRVVSGQWSVASENKRVVSGQWSVASENAGAGLSSHSPLTTDHSSSHSPLTTSHSSSHSPLTTDHSVPVGYLIGNDQYFKRDDVGCIFQINVAAEYRRSLVAASLLKAQFERSSYGCRLYCCWCAQDIAANRFWESMGFVPLAYRTGAIKPRRISDCQLPIAESEGRDRASPIGNRKSAIGNARVHIFWQKRIREGDTGDVSRGGTAWWFPFKTNGGAMRADRIVLPIPPGMRWEDELPRLIAEPPEATRLIGSQRPAKRSKKPTTPLEANRNGVRFSIPLPKEAPAKPMKQKTPKPLADPKVAAAARELRDRYLEQVHAGAVVIEPHGKYALERPISDTHPALPGPTTPLLAA